MKSESKNKQDVISPISGAPEPHVAEGCCACQFTGQGRVTPWFYPTFQTSEVQGHEASVGVFTSYFLCLLPVIAHSRLWFLCACKDQKSSKGDCHSAHGTPVSHGQCPGLNRSTCLTLPPGSSWKLHTPTLSPCLSPPMQQLSSEGGWLSKIQNVEPQLRAAPLLNPRVRKSQGKKSGQAVLSPRWSWK